MDTRADVSEFDLLLESAGRRGFLWHMFRPDRHGPDAIAGVFGHDRCVDVFVLTGGEHAHAYRSPTGPRDDIFAPGQVFWWYSGNPVWTLRAVLALPEPGDHGAPDTLVTVPPGFGVPGARTPVRIRRRSVTQQSRFGLA
jgi:hypothetical protein